MILIPHTTPHTPKPRYTGRFKTKCEGVRDKMGKKHFPFQNITFCIRTSRYSNKYLFLLSHIPKKRSSTI